MCCLQRSTGYSWRQAISIEEIAKWVDFVKSINPENVEIELGRILIPKYPLPEGENEHSYLLRLTY